MSRVDFYHLQNQTLENVLPKLWTKPDREAYFKAIERVYTNYDKHYNKK